jgi:hypothetical protein
VPFWPAVDFIGLNVYFPFVLQRGPKAKLKPSRYQMKKTFNLLQERFILSWYQVRPCVTSQQVVFRFVAYN